MQWASHVQAMLNGHADPPRYLTRTLQREIDGCVQRNYVQGSGPDPFDNTTYDSAIVAVGGSLATCYKVGVGW